MRSRFAISCFSALLLSCFYAGSARAAWLHDIDPYAIKLWEGGPIRWYGLSYLAGFAVAWLLIKRVLAVGGSVTLDPKRAADLVITIAIGIVIGGRLGYVLFYRPELFTEFYNTLPFWGVLAINQGGMASHGGMLGGIGACFYFAWKHKQRPMFLFDLFAFGAPLGLFFGRVANFINGELYGRPCAEDFPLAVKFPQELYELANVQPERVQEIITEYDNRGGGILFRGPHEFAELANIRIQAGDSDMIALIEPLLTPRHPSQLYAAGLEGLVVFAGLLWLYRKPVKAGVIGAAFCMTYAVMRIVNEFFRMPDEHLRDAEFAAVGITRGQWLSVLLFFLGAVVLVIALKKKDERLGGWRE